MPRKLPLAQRLVAKAQATNTARTRIYISIATTKHTPDCKTHGWIVILTPERSITPKRQRLWHITATPTGYESQFEEVAVDSGMAARLFQTLHRAGWIEPAAENEFSDVLANALGQYKTRWVEVLLEEFSGVQGVGRDIKTKLAVEIPVAPYEPGGELYQQPSSRSVLKEESGAGDSEDTDADESKPGASAGVKRKSSSDHEEAVRSRPNSSPGSPSSSSDSQPHIRFDTDSESDDEGDSEQHTVSEAETERAPAAASESRNLVEAASSSSHSKPEDHGDYTYPEQAIVTNAIQASSSNSVSSAGDSGSRSCIRLQDILNSDSESDSEKRTVTDRDSAAELERGFIPGLCCHKLLCREKHDCNEHVTCCEEEDCDEDTELQCCQNARRPRIGASYAA
ncbi:hypothetical protein BDV19DRAFT_391978 [Aspergillus venezuelensis]